MKGGTTPPDRPDDTVRSFQDGAAEVWLRRGQEVRGDSCEEALSCFRKALALDPLHTGALSLVAEELVHLDRGAEALGVVLEGFARGGHPSLAFIAARVAARTVESDDSVRQVFDAVEAALARPRRRRDPDLLAARGEVLSWWGNHADARRDLDAALAALPDGDGRRGDVTEALAVAYNREASAIYDGEDSERAVFLLKRAMDLAPDWVGLHVNLGRKFLSLGRMARARSEFEAAIEGDPEDPIAWFNLGHLQRDMGELEAAAESFRRVLDLDEAYPDARPELAGAYHEMSRYEDVTRLLEAELGDDPECTACNHNLGLAYLELGRVADAEARFRRAVELDGTYFRARYNLAGALVRLGRDDEGAAELIEAFKLDADLTRDWLAEDREDFDRVLDRPEIRGRLDTGGAAGADP